MRRFAKDSSLGIVFALLFLLALGGQAYSGWRLFNADQAAASLGTVSLGSYLTSASFAVDVTENWQSEYLQFLLYVLATVWLLQRGSPESKQPDRLGLGSDQDQKVGPYATEDSPAWARAGGVRTGVFSWSLSLVMAAIFVGSWFAQSVAGWAAYNELQLQSLRDPVSGTAYLRMAEFWSRSLQNWQSEFLAVGSMAVLSVYLRQRGSPESKPVGAAHSATGVEG
jgi:hypothetical protein